MALALVCAAGAVIAVPGPRRRQRPGPRTRPDGASASRVPAVVAAGALVALGAVGAGRVGAVVGLALAVPVAAALRRASRSRRAVSDARLPLLLDLAAAALRAGQPAAVALAAAADAVGGGTAPVLARVAALLRLGAAPAEAWHVALDDERLAGTARAAIRSAESGIRLAAAFEAAAAEVRDQARAGAEARAQRVGVLALAPLGLCFLPAFVCLGIAPVVIGIAHGVLGTLR